MLRTRHWLVVALLGATAWTASWVMGTERSKAGGEEKTGASRLAAQEDEAGPARIAEAILEPTAGTDMVGIGEMELQPLPPGTVFLHHVTGPGASQGVVAGSPGAGERLIYSNMKGRNATAPGRNRLLSDDVSIASTGSCTLSRYRFEVTGKVQASGEGGEYTVSYALYRKCPGSIPSTSRPAQIIPGTSGSSTFPDDAPRVIEFVVAGGTEIPLLPTVWLGLTFSRANAGPVVGTPNTEIGHSADGFDLPAGGLNSTCAATFGGYPDNPHGSFNIEMYGKEATCPAAYLAYKNLKASGPTLTTAPPLDPMGNGTFIVDDLQLEGEPCKLIGYEVAVKGTGRYDFELRATCCGGPIAGTQSFTNVSQNLGTEVQVRHLILPAPVNISAEQVFFAARVNNTGGRVVFSGLQASVGFTEDEYFDCLPGECTQQSLPDGHDGIHVALLCEGSAPSGACCDMYVTECVDVTSSTAGVDSRSCASNSECVPPATCETVCRAVPRMNCPFPQPRTTLLPSWQQGATCGPPDPFPGAYVCGESACCFANLEGFDDCENRTKNQCAAELPVKHCIGGARHLLSCTTNADCPPDGPSIGECLEAQKQWQRGQICGTPQQRCPRTACLAREGDCFEVHPRPGCVNAECCTRVCNRLDVDGEYCCDTEWDAICVETANEECSNLPPSNDECGRSPELGAIDLTSQINSPINVSVGIAGANSNESDPDVCCHTGTPKICTEGDRVGFQCVVNTDCGGGGICSIRPPRALNSVWYKFTAPQEGTIRIQTCNTSGPGRDTVMQLFAVGDPTDHMTACNSLSPVACSDDAGGGCNSFDGTLSRICANVVPGNLYYVLVGAKTYEASLDNYLLNISTPCTPPTAVPNNFCPGGTPVGDGMTAFNLSSATLACPADPCASNVTRDLWYNYTATCTGEVTVDTCSGTAVPDTNLVVYQGCDICPPSAPQVACNAASTLCGASPVEAAASFDAQIGQCFKLRVTDQVGSAVPSGNINIGCAARCGSGPVSFVDPPTNMVDARRPHPPDSLQPPLGIDAFEVSAPTVGEEICWKFCETEQEGGEANLIESVTPGMPGMWTIKLQRPMTNNAVTRLYYLGTAPVPSGLFRFHPGNVDGIGLFDHDDILDMVFGLEALEIGSQIYAMHQVDTDRSSKFTPLDLWDLMNIAVGSEAYSNMQFLSQPPTTSGTFTCGGVPPVP